MQITNGSSKIRMFPVRQTQRRWPALPENTFCVGATELNRMASEVNREWPPKILSRSNVNGLLFWQHS